MQTNREGTFLFGECSVIVSKDAGHWHLSIGNPERLPTYEELKEARYKFLPDDIYMAQIFPPTKEFVNVHKFVLHLWQIDKEVSDLKRIGLASIGG